jgi:hypothetical protein
VDKGKSVPEDQPIVAGHTALVMRVMTVVTEALTERVLLTVTVAAGGQVSAVVGSAQSAPAM